MKAKRIVSLLLVCLMVLGFTATALAARPTFPDMDYEAWYAKYLLDVVDKGIFQGDAEGTIRPHSWVTNREALTMCARMAVPDTAVRDQLRADRDGELTALFPDQAPNWWFLREAATCLELEIISYDELALLVRADPAALTGSLNGYTSKAEFARFVVRAMGLEDLVRNVPPVVLSFTDAGDIPSYLTPYVDLLQNYGIITGTTDNTFQPNKILERCECATFLSRALDYIDRKGVALELPQFTKYPWTAGYIKSVDAAREGRTITITSPFDKTDEETLALPDDAVVYLSNQPVSVTYLQEGIYARLCLDKDNVVQSVRITPKSQLRTVAGACEDLTAKSVAAAGQTFVIDRFSQVTAGAKTGDATVIDFDANYTDVAVTVNGAGRVLHMALTGGTRQVAGILTDVSLTPVASGVRTAVTVTSYGGRPTVYQVPDDAVITAGGVTAALQESFEGRHVTLRVDENDLAKIRSISVNVTDKYLQGVLRSVDVKNKKLGISQMDNSASVTYEVGADASLSYMDAPVALDKLTSNIYVTAKVEAGNIVTWLSGYSSYESYSGTLTAIEYTDPTVLRITLPGGQVTTVTVPLSKLADLTIKLDGKEVSVIDLRAGQQITVFLTYNEVTQLNALSQQANLEGVLRSVTQNEDGTFLLTVRFPDDSANTYTATNATTVTREGVNLSLSALQPGSKISLVTDGTRALSVEVASAAQGQPTGQIYGTVYTVDSGTGTLTLSLEGNSQLPPQKVQVPTGTTIIDSRGSQLYGIGRLVPGNTLRIYGSYDAKGVFVAVSIIRES